jgi:ATP-binding cassette subfamily B protein
MAAVDVAVLGLAGLAAVPIAMGLASGALDPARAVVLGGALTAVTSLGGFLPQADFPIRYGCRTLPPLLELEERIGRTGPVSTAAVPTLVPPSPPDIVFDRVGFHYPGGSQPVLDGVELAIPAGSTVALVGPNGAGKTTIIKLLARLYEPTTGAIRIDGTDLGDLEVQRWRRDLAVIFQDFARYELPARDNVGFGALNLRGDDAALDDAARRTGIVDAIHALPRGWDSPLSREFTDGSDLSGGQWQRVALARAMLAVRAGARVLVLDEPTANLDIGAEAEFYDQFLNLTTATTTILVSHRFATVRRVDRIFVIDDGRVTEQGTHDDLMVLGGTYARMFSRQAMRFADV